MLIQRYNIATLQSFLLSRASYEAFTTPGEWGVNAACRENSLDRHNDCVSLLIVSVISLGVGYLVLLLQKYR